MARAIWSGAISLGLLNVPVRMYGAIDEQDLRFHYLHRKDNSRIGYEKMCKKEGKAVSDDELVKAYQVSERTYVQLEDEDFEAAEGRTYRMFELFDFVPYEEIDPMCFADEIRPLEEVPVERVRVGKRELDMASELIDRFTSSFDIGKYRDDYREALLEVIESKRRGKAVEVDRETEAAETPDLMEALKASLEAHRGRDTPRRGGRRRSSTRTASRNCRQGRRGDDLRVTADAT